MKKTVKYKGKSIARRLNAALTRRSFAKTVLIDIIAALMVVMTWCVTVEGSRGGNLVDVSGRRFVMGGGVNIVYNTMDFFEDMRWYLHDLFNGYRPEFDVRLPFDGVSYYFNVKTYRTYPTEPVEELVEETVCAESESLQVSEQPVVIEIDNGEPIYDETAFIPDSPDAIEVRVVDSYRVEDTVHYSENASGILTAVSCGFVLLFVLQAVNAIIRGFLGGGIIKQYLRPIDDVAMMAEQLSREPYTYSDGAKSGEKEKNGVEQNETVLDIKDVETLTDAIDGIADSRARIEVQAAELGGLGAAINNMLKRLEESRRGQIRFVDDASHELRTPVAVIQGYANMLDRWGKDDPEIRDEAIAAIKNESEHIKTLLDQLLFLARGEMDRHVFEIVPVSVDLLLCEIVEESKMLDQSHTYEILGVHLNEGDGAGITVNADYAMLKQCVRILCENAVKYTPAGGTITLKCEERVSADDTGKVKREVCIEVADTGIGISPEELPRIFDRFYRGENARTDNTSGSGLGLSIARWIAEQHRGRIEAISSQGIGTKMTVIIPNEVETKE